MSLPILRLQYPNADIDELLASYHDYQSSVSHMGCEDFIYQGAASLPYDYLSEFDGSESLMTLNLEEREVVRQMYPEGSYDLVIYAYAYDDASGASAVTDLKINDWEKYSQVY